MNDRSPALTALLFVIAAGVLLQAALAGFFISGVANLRVAHIFVGWLLPWFAFAPAGVAIARRSAVATPVVVGACALPVLLWIQEVLGHVPAAATTVVHVPFGVLLFGGSLALAIASLHPTPPTSPRD